MLVTMHESAVCGSEEFFRSVLRCQLSDLDPICQSHTTVLETLK